MNNNFKIDFSRLNSRTFWDVNFSELNPEEDIEFIVARVVHKGTDQEVLYLESLLGYDTIYNILLNYKGVCEKVLNYYKTFSELTYKKNNLVVNILAGLIHKRSTN